MLGSKVLSPNVWDVILMDYKWRGLPYILDTYRCMTTLNTNSCKVIFDREDANSIYLSNQYFCTMSFIDLIGRPVLQLRVTELDAIMIVDNFIQFSDLGFNIKDLVVPMKSYNQSLLDYQIRLEHINESLIQVRVIEYSSAYESMIEKISFVIEEEAFEDMCYCMYFSWLIDLDFDGINEFGDLVSAITIDRIETEFYQ